MLFRSFSIEGQFPTESLSKLTENPFQAFSESPPRFTESLEVLSTVHQSQPADLTQPPRFSTYFENEISAQQNVLSPESRPLYPLAENKCYVRTCTQIISGQGLSYERALSIIQSEEYLNAAHIESIKRRSPRSIFDEVG